MTNVSYESFLSGPAGAHWTRVGACRRAGVCVPLFSIYTKNSVGVGDFSDLSTLFSWCERTGHTLVQLLPLNDMGDDFAPYSAKSSFALDPLYLNLRDITGVPRARFKNMIFALARSFNGGGRVRSELKTEKIKVLRAMFDAREPDDGAFEAYCKYNADWLRDDAFYKQLKQRFKGQHWESWPAVVRDRDPSALAHLESEEEASLLFFKWLQWQADRQLRAAHADARRRGIVLMGDMPFLVARDSADVWAHPGLFKLDLSSGAPPDYYAEKGQRWGMPPFDWAALARENHFYFRRKLSVAERYYDLYRIDHVIGLFRVYTIPVTAPAERAGLEGAYDPAEESRWPLQGEAALSLMLGASSLLPCGEDLGVVPPCATEALSNFSIPGLNVMRWSRDWDGSKDFFPVTDYRRNACAVLSTHDTSLLADWWNRDTTPDDRNRFWSMLGAPGEPPTTADAALVERALRACAASSAVFSIQLLSDVLSAGDALPGDPADHRINVPGTVGPRNWSVRLPRSLESLLTWSYNGRILEINKSAGRVP